MLEPSWHKWHIINYFGENVFLKEMVAALKKSASFIQISHKILYDPHPLPFEHPPNYSSPPTFRNKANEEKEEDHFFYKTLFSLIEV